jgi:hypothetical protein
LIGAGAAVLVAVVVAIVVVSSSSSSSSSSGGADAKKEVQAAATGFFAASGASTCDLVTPAYIARNYKDMADCRDSLSGATSENIAGAHVTTVAGTRATDSFTLTDGDHYSLVLVMVGGKWLVDQSADDTTDVKDAVNAYAKSEGTDVCGLVTPRLKEEQFEGAGCESSTATYDPVKATGHQITASSTRATDKLNLGNQAATLTLVKLNGEWLVDTDSTLE